MRSRPQGKVAAALVGVALLGVACGYGGSTDDPDRGGGGGYGGGYAAGPTSSGPSDITVSEDNFAFSPTELSVERGSTITIVNRNAEAPHTFTIDGQGIDVVNQPEQSRVLRLGLAAGTYTFMCRFHEGAGMTGTLTVTAE